MFTLNIAFYYHTYFKLFYIISDELWNLHLQLIDTNDFEASNRDWKIQYYDLVMPSNLESRAYCAEYNVRKNVLIKFIIISGIINQIWQTLSERDEW